VNSDNSYTEEKAHGQFSDAPSGLHQAYQIYGILGWVLKLEYHNMAIDIIFLM
jgi:hypothetical protein